MILFRKRHIQAGLSDMSPDPPRTHAELTAPLRQALDRALQSAPERVRRVSAGGQAVWLKQAERLSLRWRLQKGDPRCGLEAERAGLRVLGELGLPVARLVAEGPGYLATAEAGVALADILADPAQGGARRLAGFSAAGAALAALHRAGVAHGRPALRDICWDGAQARFIDLERYRSGPAKPRRMARDLLILLHSVLVIRPEPGPELASVLAGWQSGAPEGLWPEVVRQAARLARLRGVARLVRHWRPESRELAAGLALLDWLAGQEAG